MTSPEPQAVPVPPLPLPALPPAVAAVERHLAQIADRVELWTTGLSRTFADHRGAFTASAIDRMVKPGVDDLLADADSGAAGAGFVTAEGFVSGRTDFMAWWQGPGADRVDALANLSDADQDRYRDADWYRRPFASGHLVITGPYLDLLCTDAFALTYTAPVVPFDGADPVGVAGIDVTVASLERRVTSLLAAVGPTASLVDAEERVIVTASGRIAPGEFLVDTGRRWTLGHGLAIAV